MAALVLRTAGRAGEASHCSRRRTRRRRRVVAWEATHRHDTFRLQRLLGGRQRLQHGLNGQAPANHARGAWDDLPSRLQAQHLRHASAKRLGHRGRRDVCGTVSPAERHSTARQMQGPLRSIETRGAWQRVPRAQDGASLSASPSPPPQTFEILLLTMMAPIDSCVCQPPRGHVVTRARHALMRSVAVGAVPRVRKLRTEGPGPLPRAVAAARRGWARPGRRSW